MGDWLHSLPPPPPYTLWRKLRPPLFPTLGRAWGMGVVGGCTMQGNTSLANITTMVEMQYWRNLCTLNILAANAITQIVPCSSSLYTVFHSVIFNSVGMFQIAQESFAVVKELLDRGRRMTGRGGEGWLPDPDPMDLRQPPATAWAAAPTKVSSKGFDSRQSCSINQK